MPHPTFLCLPVPGKRERKTRVAEDSAHHEKATGHLADLELLTSARPRAPAMPGELEAAANDQPCSGDNHGPSAPRTRLPGAVPGVLTA